MNFITKLIQLVVFIGIYPSIFGTDVAPSTCVEQQVLDLFTKWRQGDMLPWPLPSLSTVTIPSYTGQYAGYGIKLTFTTGNMSLTGLDGFQVKELRVSTDDLLAAYGAIDFPYLALTTDNYNLKGQAYVFYSLKGSGVMNLVFRNVSLMFRMKLSPNANSVIDGIQINDVKLNYKLDGIHVNLADCSWPVNKVLNAEGLSIIESYHNTIVDAATEALKSSLNKYFSTVAPELLTNAIVSSC